MESIATNRRVHALCHTHSLTHKPFLWHHAVDGDPCLEMASGELCEGALVSWVNAATIPVAGDKRINPTSCVAALRSVLVVELKTTVFSWLKYVVRCAEARSGSRGGC